MQVNPERYIWAAVVLIGLIIAAATVLIVTNHSAELERFAILVADGVFAAVNAFVVWRATRNTENRVRHELDEQTTKINGAINGASKKGP